MRIETKQTIKIYWRHAKKYPWPLFTIVLSIWVASAIDTYVPLWYKKFFNILSESGTSSYPELVRILLVILGLQGITWIFWRSATFTNNFFQPRVMADIVNFCFQYIHGHSYAFFNNTFVGSLVKKVSRFSRSFEGLTDQFFWNLGRTTFRFVLMLAVLFVLYWQVALVVLVWSVLFLSFHLWFARYKLKYDYERSQMDTKTSAHLADTITNQLNVKLFGGLRREVKEQKSLTQKWFQIYKFSWDLDAMVEALQSGLLFVLQFAVFFVALRFYRTGVVTLGDFVLIQAYLFSLFEHFWDMGRNIRRIYEHLAEAAEMTEILNTPHEVIDKPDSMELNVKEGLIEFRDVDFGYHAKQKVFEGFNLQIRPGERVALIGPSGGGKSTIVKLLFRFMDLQSGEVLIDGQNIADTAQESLRNQVSLVPQEPILFHRSLYENIRYAKPDATEEEIITAAKLAHCHEFISNFPDGYETLVGERGVKLSGGERQRVAIARAILKDAPILVLDEATSSLDSESEMFIQQALSELMSGRTTIVIAHRLSTIMKMDRIVVIDDGRIIEEGSHEELLKVQQGLYQKLWEIQAGGFAG